MKRFPLSLSMQPSQGQMVESRGGQQGGQRQQAEADKTGDDGPLGVVAEPRHVVAKREPPCVVLPVPGD